MIKASAHLSSPEYPLLLALPVPLLFACTLVMLLLSLGKTKLKLASPAFPDQGQWDQGISFTLYVTNQLIEFVAMQEQLSGPD